jgi:hypothetical protein
MKEQVDTIVNSIERSQLSSANNSIDMSNVAQDFAYNLGGNRTPDSKEKSDPNFERFEEMSRFNLDHSEISRKLTKRLD